MGREEGRVKRLAREAGPHQGSGTLRHSSRAGSSTTAAHQRRHDSGGAVAAAATACCSQRSPPLRAWPQPWPPPSWAQHPPSWRQPPVAATCSGSSECQLGGHPESCALLHSQPQCVISQPAAVRYFAASQPASHHPPACPVSLPAAPQAAPRPPAWPWSGPPHRRPGQPWPQ